VEVFWELKLNKMIQNDTKKCNITTQSDATNPNIPRQNIETKEMELMKIKMKWIKNGESRQSLQKTGLYVIPLFTVVFTFIYLIVAIVCYM
jgi:hypothetical protein